MSKDRMGATSGTCLNCPDKPVHTRGVCSACYFAIRRAGPKAERQAIRDGQILAAATRGPVPMNGYAKKQAAKMRRAAK